MSTAAVDIGREVSTGAVNVGGGGLAGGRDGEVSIDAIGVIGVETAEVAFKVSPAVAAGGSLVLLGVISAVAAACLLR